MFIANSIITILVVAFFIYNIYKIIEEYKKCKTIDEKILAWIFMIIIAYPTIIFCFDFFNIPSRIGWINTMDSKIWLECIFNYTVTILSAIIGAFITIQSVKLSINDQEKVRIEENKKKALPLLKIDNAEHYDYRYKWVRFNCIFTEESKERERKDISNTARVTLKINNVGMRELYNLCIGDFESIFFKPENEYQYISPIVYKDDNININLFFYEMGCYDNDLSRDNLNDTVSWIEFKCYFKDCYENWYYQTLKLSLIHKVIADKPLEQRALEIRIMDTEVASTPKEIEYKNLPWNNGKELINGKEEDF